MKNINCTNKKIIIIIIVIALTMLTVSYLGLSRNFANYESSEIGELVGYLNIDSIGLYKAEVRLGTNKATLREAIGLYINGAESLQGYNGNICMYSYSTGEEKSYFQNIRNLKIGDEVEYITNGEKRKYAVQQMELLDNNKINYMNPTKENKLTLITRCK